MNKLIILVSLFCINNAIAQKSSSILVNGNKFIIKSYFLGADSVDGKKKQEPDSIQIYRNGAKLLSHILKDVSNDCNSSALELGEWEVIDTSIVFYSYYSFNGKCMHCPFGVKKQVYVVNNKGVVSLKEALVSINWTTAGQRFLTDTEAKNIPNLTLEYLRHAKMLKGKEGFTG